MSKFVMDCSKSLYVFEVPSPIGNIIMKTCTVGIHEVSYHPDINDENFSPQNSITEGIDSKSRTLTRPAELGIEWLSQYFKDPTSVKGLELPKLCPLQDQKFRSSVWEKLFESVDVGETVTYKELATRLNNPGAVRAVGSAMKNNPICILVPCHRVVRNDGMGLYSGGTRQKVKEWLLNHEGIDLTQFKKK